MKFGGKSDGGGDNDDIEDENGTTRIMTVSGLSFSDKPSSGQINNEEATELLSDDEDDYLHSPQETKATRRKSKDGVRHRDCSKWLRPAGLLFSIIVLGVIAFTSSDTLLRSANVHLNIFRLFNLGDEVAGSSYKIGIELHPANHVFRRPATITHHWTITKGLLFPDGVKKEVYLVNGEFPGPTIQCRSGDRLRIHVINQLADEGISIHWHGLQMRNANSMDGAVGFTQCPIPAGKKFTYEFDVDEEQSGTFWWHAHSQTQRGDGMYGGLVVHKPAETHSEMEVYGYKKEMMLLIGDWYHRDGAEVLDWYTSVRGFGNEPVPDSLLVNGVGKFVCSMAVPARPVECVEVEKEQVLGLPDKATRIRVVNVGTLAGFSLGAESGSLTPLTVDGGHHIDGRAVDSVGIIHPGERVDLISKWNNTPPNLPRLRLSLDRENFKYPNHALRPDQSFPIFQSTGSASSTNNDDDLNETPIRLDSDTHFDLALASAKASTDFRELGVQLPPTAEQTILLYTKTQKLSINANHPQGYMNRTSWTPQSPALISLPRSSWDGNQLIPFIPTNASDPIWVDIILNNLDDGSHPFHLHGHDFYVLASHRSEHGWGSYSPWATAGSSSIAPKLNLVNPVMKDTVSVPRRGYVVLRFRADNPGVWMLHCHVLFHQGSGMAMGLHVGSEELHKDIDAMAAEFCTD